VNHALRMIEPRAKCATPAWLLTRARRMSAGCYACAGDRGPRRSRCRPASAHLPHSRRAGDLKPGDILSCRFPPARSWCYRRACRCCRAAASASRAAIWRSNAKNYARSNSVTIDKTLLAEKLRLPMNATQSRRAPSSILRQDDSQSPPATSSLCPPGWPVTLVDGGRAHPHSRSATCCTSTGSAVVGSTVRREPLAVFLTLRARSWLPGDFCRRHE